jgi:hypothetical protein
MEVNGGRGGRDVRFAPKSDISTGSDSVQYFRAAASLCSALN